MLEVNKIGFLHSRKIKQQGWVLCGRRAKEMLGPASKEAPVNIASETVCRTFSHSGATTHFHRAPLPCSCKGGVGASKSLCWKLNHLGFMYWFSSVVVTNYQRRDSLNNRDLILTVLETGKSKIKVPVNLVPGENCLPGFQIATFSLCSVV